MLPRPTPLSLSLMEALWAAGGSVDLAARELGLTYRVEDGSTYLVTILGRLYVDKREEQSRALVISPLASRRLLRTADRIERDFRENFLPQFIDETRLLNVVDFEKLSTAELIAEIKRLHDRFVFDTHVAVDVVNIAAGFYLDRARKVLSADAIDPSSLLGHIPETHEARAIAEINAAPAKSRRWLLLKNFGHRAVLDYELAEPRYAEDLNTLNRMIAGRVQAGRPGYQNTPALSKSQAKMRRHRAALPDAEGGCQASLAQRNGGAAPRGADARPALRTRRARLLSALRRAAVAERPECRAAARACPGCGRRRRSGCVTRPSLPSVAAGARPRSGVRRRPGDKACAARRHPRHASVRQQGGRGTRPRHLGGRRRAWQPDGGLPRRRHHRCVDDQPGMAALLLAGRRLRQRGRRLAQPSGDPGARIRCRHDRRHRGHRPHRRRRPAAAAISTAGSRS